MLLGADEDAFEVAETEFDSKFMASMAAHAGSQLNGGLQQIPAGPDRYPFLGQAIDESACYENVPLSRHVSTGPYELRGSVPSAETDLSPHVQYELRTRPYSPRPQSSGPQAALVGGDVAQPAADHRIEDDNDSNSDSDHVWVQLMQIHPQTSSHLSTAALRSSSQHITVSESSRRPSPAKVIERQHGDVLIPSTPNGTGCHAAHSLGPSESSHQPPASLIPILRLAKLPPKPKRQAPEDVDDNALWRQFIIGSDDEGSEASGIIKSSQSTKNVVGPVSSLSLSVSGLGTSDHATLGDTSFMS